jgi:hypothetical protein
MHIVSVFILCDVEFWYIIDCNFGLRKNKSKFLWVKLSSVTVPLQYILTMKYPEKHATYNLLVFFLIIIHGYLQLFWNKQMTSTDDILYKNFAQVKRYKNCSIWWIGNAHISTISVVLW